MRISVQLGFPLSSNHTRHVALVARGFATPGTVPADTLALQFTAAAVILFLADAVAVDRQLSQLSELRVHVQGHCEFCLIYTEQKVSAMTALQYDFPAARKAAEAYAQQDEKFKEQVLAEARAFLQSRARNPPTMATKPPTDAEINAVIEAHAVPKPKPKPKIKRTGKGDKITHYFARL